MIDGVAYSRGWHDWRQKPSGKWEARWSDETGKARGKCFLTESQAKLHAFNRAKELLDGEMGLSVPTKDLREAFDNFISRYTDPGTIALFNRHFDNFMSTYPNVRIAGHLTKDLFEKYNVVLLGKGHNSGGRLHILTQLKVFVNYCRERNYLRADPFFKFKMPKSEFEGRPLNPDEYAKMTAIDPGYETGDIWINRALRIGNPSLLRISQVWKLKPEHFREPGLIYVWGIKEQRTEWKPLHQTALEAVRELLAITPAGVRFFAHWNTLDAMRKQFRRKADRVGLHGVRFHDAGKVTRVTELDAAGVGLGALSALSNTTKATLAKHYIKEDRRRAYAAYQTYRGPTDSLKTTEKANLDPIEPTKAEVEITSNLRQI